MGAERGKPQVGTENKTPVNMRLSASKKFVY